VHKWTDGGFVLWWFHFGNRSGRCSQASALAVPLIRSHPTNQTGEIMEPASPGTPALPNDLLLVEDDPIIALDFEDTILGLGVRTVRTAAGVARALQLIADRAPDFALLDVSLVREKSFAIAERLDALNIPFAFVTGYGADVRMPQAFAERPRLGKPCSTEALETVLKLHGRK
jgi:CheY-like chemotaxis protein